MDGTSMNRWMEKKHFQIESKNVYQQTLINICNE